MRSFFFFPGSSLWRKMVMFFFCRIHSDITPLRPFIFPLDSGRVFFCCAVILSILRDPLLSPNIIPLLHFKGGKEQREIRVDHQRIEEEYITKEKGAVLYAAEKEKGEIGSDVIIPCPAVIIDLSFFFPFFFFFFVTSLVGLYWEPHRLLAIQETSTTSSSTQLHTVYKELGPLPYQLKWNNETTQKHIVNSPKCNDLCEGGSS